MYDTDSPAEPVPAERPASIPFSSTDPEKYMSLNWATGLITWLYENHPTIFGAGMWHVWGIEKTKRASNGHRS